MSLTESKYKALCERLRALGKVAVAFSAGVDSTLLLKTAHDLLGENAVAITAKLRSFPDRELAAAKEFCKKENVEQIIIEIDELSDVSGFAENPPDRCRICKRAVFSRIIAAARERGLTVVDGSNADDAGDYRPGLAALDELGVISPLREAGLSKAEIRALSKKAGLSTWDKPAYACLSTRVPYGERITAQKLEMIGKAESFITDLGFSQVRVRSSEGAARIELEKADIPRAAKQAEAINERLLSLGFSRVTLDLGGYRVSGKEFLRKEKER